MSAKAFLLQECKNVADLLAKTLRYDYGLDGSRDFFEECDVRLKFITSELDLTIESDTSSLASHGARLNDLAGLICRIERSSLGEYSWPFVEELKKIATAICTEASLFGANTPPKIFVLADGGLDSYAIYPESRRPSATKRLLLTIVFPKSLKHFVLLHPILGHEIGHAIWRCSKHQNTLNTSVVSVLKDAGGLFASPDTIADHLYSAGAPDEAKKFLGLLEQKFGINRANIFTSCADWDAWIEEILCDLIGLATFGPGFVGALCELLYGLNPSGVEFGKSHPPSAWRVNLIIRGAKVLGFDQVPAAPHPLKEFLERFWGDIRLTQKTGAWFNVFNDNQLVAALGAIQNLLNQHPPSPYPEPDFDVVHNLLRQLVNMIPPVGYQINADDNPECSTVDFRHVIYAGWIASRNEPTIPFDLINKLCEHGIMQQSAIGMTLKKVN